MREDPSNKTVSLTGSCIHLGCIRVVQQRRDPVLLDEQRQEQTLEAKHDEGLYCTPLGQWHDERPGARVMHEDHQLSYPWVLGREMERMSQVNLDDSKGRRQNGSEWETTFEACVPERGAHG